MFLLVTEAAALSLSGGILYSSSSLLSTGDTHTHTDTERYLINIRKCWYFVYVITVLMERKGVLIREVFFNQGCPTAFGEEKVSL